MPDLFDITLDAAVAFPRLDEYFGLWAFEESRFRTMFNHVARMDLSAHVRAQQNKPAAQARVVSGARSAEGQAIAIVKLQGTLMKQESSLEESTSTVRARAEIRAAARDTSIDGILLIIDSPGGTVSGTKDLADEVARATEQKPVYAYIEDLGASAAYWVATQADQVFANTDTALVGSIGTLFGIYDMSEMAEKEGIKAMVFATGDIKGAGFPGTKITDEQKAYFQGIVDQTQKAFDAAVKTARGFSDDQLAAVRTGAVFLARDAQSRGLIDGVQTLDATVEQLFTEISQRSTRAGDGVGASTAMENKTMPDPEQKQPVAATYEQIKAECYGASSEFICQQLDAKATIDQARKAHMEQQQAIVEARTKERDDAIKAADEAKAKKPTGVDPLGDGGGEKPKASGDAIAEWHAAVKAEMERGHDKARATANVVRKQPDLHSAYLEAYNAEAGRTAAA